MAEERFGSLTLRAGVMSAFGLTWYKGKRNEKKQKKMMRYHEETSELTA